MVETINIWVLIKSAILGYTAGWLTKLVKGLFSRTLGFNCALPQVSTTTLRRSVRQSGYTDLDWALMIATAHD